MRREPFSLLLLLSSVGITKYQLDQGDHMEATVKMILDFFITFAKDWPILASIIVIMGTLRMFLKPVFTFIKEIVALTKTTKDDEVVAKVEASAAYKWVMFLVDYLASIKLPGAK